MRLGRDNYRIQAAQAKKLFLTYDQQELIRRCRLRCDEDYLYTDLLSEPYRIHRRTGDMERLHEGSWVDGNSFGEVMTILDWICDSKPDRFVTGRWINIVTHGHYFHRELQEKADIRFEIDTYWSYVAGLNSVDLLKKLGDRVDIIHLKDGDSAGKGVSLGQGTAPVKEVREYALAHGQEIVVESEGLDPTGEEEVKRCIDFLYSLG